MSISSISGSLSSIYQTAQSNGAGRAQGRTPPEGVQGGRPPGPPPGGGMDEAVIQSLAEALGVSSTGSTTDTDGATGTTATDGTNTSTSVEDAFGSFMQSLMSALHGQGGASDAEGEGNGTQEVRGHHGHGGPGRIASDLQSLMARLGGTSTSGNGTGSGTASDTGAAESALQGSFDNLLGAMGAATDNSSATLNSFLQNLQGRLADVRPQGNLVNTTA